MTEAAQSWSIYICVLCFFSVCGFAFCLPPACASRGLVMDPPQFPLPIVIDSTSTQKVRVTSCEAFCDPERRGTDWRLELAVSECALEDTEIDWREVPQHLYLNACRTFYLMWEGRRGTGNQLRVDFRLVAVREKPRWHLARHSPEDTEREVIVSVWIQIPARHQIWPAGRELGGHVTRWAKTTILEAPRAVPPPPDTGFGPPGPMFPLPIVTDCDQPVRVEWYKASANTESRGTDWLLNLAVSVDYLDDTMTEWSQVPQNLYLNACGTFDLRWDGYWLGTGKSLRVDFKIVAVREQPFWDQKRRKNPECTEREVIVSVKFQIPAEHQIWPAADALPDKVIEWARTAILDAVRRAVPPPPDTGFGPPGKRRCTRGP